VDGPTADPANHRRQGPVKVASARLDFRRGAGLVAAVVDLRGYMEREGRSGTPRPAGSVRGDVVDHW